MGSTRIRSAQITSEDATNDYGLVADGSGNADWEAVSAVSALDDLTDVNAPSPSNGQVLTWDDDPGEWIAADPTGGSVDAADVTYTPAVAADWDSDTDPGDVDNALDQLAERVDDLEGAGPPVLDAADITYTPTTVTDWDSDADPGNVDDALDQLAERIDDIEGAAGHDAVTLDGDAAVLLDLSGQEIGLDTQTANYVFAGPATGAANEPTFRALVAADVGTGTPDNTKFLRDDMSWQAVSGSVATDAIWDAKGDLAIGTGANTAGRLAAGSNGQVPVYASGETTGVKPAYPQPLIGTAYASAKDSHTANNTWEAVNSMSVTLTVPFASASLLCWFTATVAPTSANYEQYKFEFYLDSTTESESFRSQKNANPANTPYYNFNMHTVFTGITAASHTVVVRWHDNSSSLDLDIYERRLTVMICQ